MPFKFSNVKIIRDIDTTTWGKPKEPINLDGFTGQLPPIFMKPIDATFAQLIELRRSLNLDRPIGR